MIILTSCWYSLKSKFPEHTYLQWMDNLLSNVVNFTLVVYTDNNGYDFLFSKYGTNENIHFIIKQLENLVGYKYKNFWIENHRKNILLNNNIDWKLNMLWCEKINFVYETLLKYTNYTYYGWIDIGYFRNRPKKDITIEEIRRFPNIEKVNNLSNKIHYALVNNDMSYVQYIYNCVINNQIIPANQITIGGGFFIAHYSLIENWKKLFTSKLESYIKHNKLVKDDQIILADCVFSNLSLFELHQEINKSADNWFMFSRLLL